MEVDSPSKELKKVQKKVENLESDIGELKAELKRFEGANAKEEYKKLSSDMKEDYPSASDYRKHLREQLKDLKEDKNNLQTEKNNLQTEKNNLQTEKNKLLGIKEQEKAEKVKLIEKETEQLKALNKKAAGKLYNCMRHT